MLFTHFTINNRPEVVLDMANKTTKKVTASVKKPVSAGTKKPAKAAKKGDTRSYYDKDIKLLWGLAAARCAFKKCRKECVAEGTKTDRAAIFGKIAHIVAHSDTGPRADPTYDKKLRDKYENLILLCGNDHDIVDFQPNTYTILDLRGWKTEHEIWVRASLAQEIPSVGFAELEVTTKALLSQPMKPEEILTLTPPLEKMGKNNLTSDSHYLVSLGMSKSREVETFVSHVALIDSDFPERLKAGFVEQYNKFREQGIEGDELFTLMHQFASGDSSDFKKQASGLAVLMYLFEKCEVFEV